MANRNNPIRSTVEHVPGYPTTLIIYKAEFSRFYQARARVGKMVTRSLKTEIRSHAIQRAKEFYRELMAKQSQGLPVTESAANFSKAAEALLNEDRARVARGERKQSMVDDLEYIYEKDLLPFFQHDNVKNVNYKRIQEYVTHLQGRNVSSQTIKNHFIQLRKILKQAHKLEMIDKLPIFPTINAQDNPREWFNEEQYSALLRAIRKAIKDKVVVRYVPITEELEHLTTFMTNTFLRPQDIKLLQHKHITVVKKPNRAYLKIMAKGKTKPAKVVSTKAAVSLYEQFLKGKPDEYVFFHQYERNHAMSVMAKQFKYVLEQAGLKEGENAGERTLYSLRHTAIMNQLTNRGMDIHVLAKNCRTSVEMIERFYASHLEAEMNVHQLHQQEEPGATLEDFFEDETTE